MSELQKQETFAPTKKARESGTLQKSATTKPEAKKPNLERRMTNSEAMNQIVKARLEAMTNKKKRIKESDSENSSSSDDE